MFTLYVRKYFTAGPLKGLYYNDKVTGSDMDKLARQWAVGTEVKRPVGCSPYRIVDASFQSFAR